MLLIDLTHTSHTRARTGVQRVCRSLYFVGAQTAFVACTHDPYAQTWRELRPWESANLTDDKPTASRGPRWPVMERLRSRLAGFRRGSISCLPCSKGLIVPEIFSAKTAAHFDTLFAAIHGPKIAIFHDAIALKFPELTPAKTVARFPRYLQELQQFDGIAAVSEDSRQSLLAYWNWLGVSPRAVVRTIPLAAPIPSHALDSFGPSTSTAAKIPIILSVGTIEGRKNHLALLEAADALWRKGVSFELRLIGLGHPETGRAALRKIDDLQKAGRPLRYDGAVDENTLEAAYAECSFTVYPSLMEGFGLPILESVQRGKPCICSAHGAIGEAARPGGCQMCESVDAATLSAQMEILLYDPDRRERLREDALKRPPRSWEQYASELAVFVEELRSAQHR